MAGARYTLAASCRCLFLLLLTLLSLNLVAAAAAPLNTERCRSRCRRTFPPGRGEETTAAREGALEACYRGCGLFSICHFVDVSAELNDTRADCESACLEAYAVGPEQTGCTTGCRHQLPELQSGQGKISSPVGPPSFRSVLDLVSGFCSKIVGSAKSFFSTWAHYLQSDNGKAEEVQSQPEIDYPVSDLQEPRAEVTEKAWIPSRPSTLKPYRDLQENPENAPSKELKMKEKLQHSESPPPEHDFLGCMSKRSGLPRWILVACLFLSIMVMIWLSCATLATAPEQHVKTQPLSINGDQEYMDDMAKPAKFPFQPVIALAVCSTEESADAGPLPVKVDLEKTII
ncbi:transmembrane protein 59-like [Rhinatrema bivittatum]|uniref:transmembrane protein 59-like n=1 Tax=Rhinatrema bivittatum TaxID=194408 RepID=UPI00112CBA0B|nr:transmembrane protein 59-like [Rhinatrema bivittatum]